MYIIFELDTFFESCSTHFNYLVIAFIVKAYVISYWFSRTIVSWQTSPLNQNSSHLDTLVGRRRNTMLKMYDSRKSIRIETNASNLIIDACLSQKYEGKWHSMTYFSKKFSSTKQNYDIHDKKLLAIITYLKSWRAYVEEELNLTILTNHKNLLHFTITKQLNKR